MRTAEGKWLKVRVKTGIKVDTDFIIVHLIYLLIIDTQYYGTQNLIIFVLLFFIL